MKGINVDNTIRSAAVRAAANFTFILPIGPRKRRAYLLTTLGLFSVIGLVFMLKLSPKSREYLRSGYVKIRDRIYPIGAGTPQRVAVCVVGRLRSFYAPLIHESMLDNFIKPLNANPDATDVFFQVEESLKTDSYNPHCDNLPVQYPLKSTLEKYDPALVSWERPSCSEEYIKNSSCCRVINNQAKDAFDQKQNSWSLWQSYMRKISCLNKVFDFEKQNDIQYDWFVIMRTDLHFFERPVFTVDTLLPNRIYSSSKESGEAPGDYFYIIPRSLIRPFLNEMSTFTNYACETHSEPPNMIEAPLHWRMEEVNIPWQLLPIYFAIVRCQGNAECGRLGNEVWEDSTPVLLKGAVATPKRYCDWRNDMQFLSPREES